MHNNRFSEKKTCPIRPDAHRPHSAAPALRDSCAKVVPMYTYGAMRTSVGSCAERATYPLPPPIAGGGPTMVRTADSSVQGNARSVDHRAHLASPWYTK